MHEKEGLNKEGFNKWGKEGFNKWGKRGLGQILALD